MHCWIHRCFAFVSIVSEIAGLSSRCLDISEMIRDEYPIGNYAGVQIKLIWSIHAGFIGVWRFLSFLSEIAGLLDASIYQRWSVMNIRTVFISALSFQIKLIWSIHHVGLIDGLDLIWNANSVYQVGRFFSCLFFCTIVITILDRRSLVNVLAKYRCASVNCIYDIA